MSTENFGGKNPPIYDHIQPYMPWWQCGAVFTWNQAASSISLGFFWQPLTQYMWTFWISTTVNMFYTCVFSCTEIKLLLLRQAKKKLTERLSKNNTSKYLIPAIWIRADSSLAPSQWETSLQSNAVSHWLDTNLESALWMARVVGRVSIEIRSLGIGSHETITPCNHPQNIEAKKRWVPFWQMTFS